MKKILFIAILSLAATAAFAFDFGLIIENTTGVITTENNQFLQKDKVSLWTLFDLSETSAFALEGFYRFHLQEPYHAYALDRFELSVNFPVIGVNSFLFGFLAWAAYAPRTSPIISSPTRWTAPVWCTAMPS